MWPGFRDRVSAAIHDNKNVLPAFKFSYLKSRSLVELHTLGEWQLKDDNYIEALEWLKQLYDRKYPMSHMKGYDSSELKQFRLMLGI